MGIEYKNRRGYVYRLLVGKTKTGKPKYYMAKSKKAQGGPVDEMPEGFEIHEDPVDGRVVLRKTRPRKVTEQEQRYLEDAIRQYSEVRHFIVAADGDALVVYTSSFSPKGSGAEQIADLFGPRGLEVFSSHANYSKMMQFVLWNEEKRLFTVGRWCFRGSIDDWWHLGGPSPLPELAEKYLPHLGQESFCELM